VGFLDYFFNLIIDNKRGQVVRIIWNPQYLKVEFGLREIKTYDFIRIDVVQIFDILLHDIHVQYKSHLIGGDNNTLVIRLLLWSISYAL